MTEESRKNDIQIILKYRYRIADDVIFPAVVVRLTLTKNREINSAVLLKSNA